jgi:predicted lipoprotein with Yx(FWY)xxD motif
MHIQSLLRLPLAVCCFLITLAVAPIALAAPGLQASAPIQLATNPKFGSILVNGQGMTLYTLSSEAGGKIACSGGCLAVWPPVLVPAGTTVPTAAPGVLGTLGVITRPDGTVQATLNGFPLYTFAHDAAPGDTNGEGIAAFGGTWHVVQNTLTPLAATAVDRLAIHITATGSTVWGTVTVRYTRGHSLVQQSCARSSCVLHVPHGAKVQLGQKATSTSSWPFKDWQISANRGTRTVTSASPSVKVNKSMSVTAVYVLAQTKSSSPPGTGYQP